MMNRRHHQGVITPRPLALALIKFHSWTLEIAVERQGLRV